MSNIKAVKDFYNSSYKELSLEAQRLFPSEAFVRFFSKYVKKIKNKSKENINIIELGCGICSNLIPVIQEGYKCYGIDISEKCIDICKKRLDVMSLSAELLAVNCLEKNFGFNIKFDVIFDVFSMYCLNTNDFKKLLKNIYNSLNDEGYFYSFFPSKNSIAFTNHKPAKLVDEDTLNGIYREDSPYYGNFYNFRFMYPLEYKSLLEKNGFEVIELNTITRNYNMKETFEYISITAKKM